MPGPVSSGRQSIRHRSIDKVIKKILARKKIPFTTYNFSLTFLNEAQLLI